MSSSNVNNSEVSFSQIPMSKILLPPENTLSIDTRGNEKVLVYDVELPGKRDYIDATTYYPDFFLEKEWKVKKVGGLEWLLKDLIEIHTGDDNTVVDFVYKWGPLWASGNEYHDPEAVWSPLVIPFEPQSFWISPKYYEETRWEERLLKWKPVEKVERYRTLSRKLSAIVDWMRKTEKGQRVSADDIALLNYEGKTSTEEERSRYSELTFQKEMITKTLHFYLSKNVGQRFSVQLSEKDKGFETEIQYFTGWGFFWVACLLVTHLISKDNLICMCDSCNKVYERRPPRRMPKKGQYNYCSQCSENKLFWKLYDRDGKRKTNRKEKNDQLEG